MALHMGVQVPCTGR